MKDDAIVLVEATEIMESLPSAMRHDEQIMDCVIESLQSGISKVEARQDALEIAHMKLEQTVAHGFNLVNNEIQGIKHQGEKDTIHREYAKQALDRATAIAENAWAKTQEVAIGVAKAEAKADNARDLAKQSNSKFQFDPLTGMTVCAIALIAVFTLFSFRVEKSQPIPQGQVPLLCGVDVTCIPNSQKPIPTNNRGGV